jgi:hypothetical protein
VRGRRPIRYVAAAVVLAVAGAVPAAAEGPPERPDTRQVMFVGNNWEGTADIVDARTFQRLARINTIPDREERMAEIQSDPERLAFFLAIRQAVGEGNDQFTDDMFTSHDGRFVYVSRPSFADVVGISLRTGEIVWRFPMEGQRSDHMAISPDGTTLLVSDSTANKVHRLDAATGRKTGEFPSGDSPHENNYSKDGRLVYHASIGRVYTPTDQELIGPLELIRDTTKGERYFQIVDANTMQVLERFDMGDKLAEAGHPEMESAVRPMALAPDERILYAQISFHHGFVEYSFDEDRVLRVANLPVSEEAQNTPREQYLLDSAHHGLAMNAAGTKLCVAGTMSDYAAIVSRATFAAKLFSVGEKPYWSTNGPVEDHCWVSFSGDDKVGVFSYSEERQLAEIPVGDHPQRVRAGAVRHNLLAALPVARGARDNLRPRIRVAGLPRRRCTTGGFRVRVRVVDQSRLRGARVAMGSRRLKRTTRKRFRVKIKTQRMRAGRHRVRFRATDAAGNRARRVISFRRCERG